MTADIVTPLIHKYKEFSNGFYELAVFTLLANVDKIEIKLTQGTWVFIPNKPDIKFNKIPLIVVIKDDKTSNFTGELKDGLVK